MTADDVWAQMLKSLRARVTALEAKVPRALEAAREAGRREEREACARLAEAQPYYPDTHTGMRQQWVKDQIAAAIRARGDAT
jgi:hypothetical protein